MSYIPNAKNLQHPTNDDDAAILTAEILVIKKYLASRFGDFDASLTSNTQNIGTLQSQQTALTSAVNALTGEGIGTIKFGPYGSTPTGWVFLDGSLLQRQQNGADTPLWEYVKNYYKRVDDSLRAQNPGAFTNGNGSSNYRLPDMSGLFVRGVGGNSDALGALQGDAIRNITGQTIAISSSATDPSGAPTGVFSTSGDRGNNRIGAGGGEDSYSQVFDASTVVPTANENRPLNIAWNFIIRES